MRCPCLQMAYHLSKFNFSLTLLVSVNLRKCLLFCLFNVIQYFHTAIIIYELYFLDLNMHLQICSMATTVEPRTRVSHCASNLLYKLPFVSIFVLYTRKNRSTAYAVAG